MPTRTILFVDDNENVIDGLRRTLRNERKQWRLYFVESGEKALELMEQVSISLIVTDMMMPGITGDQLLQTVTERFPSTVRVVLSGYADENSLKKALQVSHQYLTKPCSPEFLKETIFQIFKIQECISNANLIEHIGDINQLPSLPDIYQELKRVVKRESCSSHAIAEILSKDMAMSAKLLQTVNSPFFGINRKISNLDEAVTFIGVKQLTNLVLNSYIQGFFQVKNAKFTGFLNYLSQDSMRTAELAKQISAAENLSDDRQDQAYLGGLLHNLGLLIIMSKFSQGFEELVFKVVNSDEPVSLIEKQLFGFTREEAGAYVLALWKIPSRVIESILLQKAPNLSDYTQMNALSTVHAAASLLKPATHNNGGRIFEISLDTAYFQRIDKLDRLPHWESLKNQMLKRW